jgi:phosphate transport system permease protein
LLGIGRAVAETAVLLFTSGYVDRMPGGDAPAYASALVLVAMLLCINIFAMKLVQDWQRRRAILE